MLLATEYIYEIEEQEYDVQSFPHNMKVKGPIPTKLFKIQFDDTNTKCKCKQNNPCGIVYAEFDTKKQLITGHSDCEGTWQHFKYTIVEELFERTDDIRWVLNEHELDENPKLIGLYCGNELVTDGYST